MFDKLEDLVKRLDEVMQERSGVSGAGNPQPAAQAAPAPSPTPKPLPPIDVGKLAAMRAVRSAARLETMVIINRIISQSTPMAAPRPNS